MASKRCCFPVSGEGDHRPPKYYLFPVFIVFPAGPCPDLACRVCTAFPFGGRVFARCGAAPAVPCADMCTDRAPTVTHRALLVPTAPAEGLRAGHCSHIAPGTEGRHRAAGRERLVLPQRAREARGWNPLPCWSSASLWGEPQPGGSLRLLAPCLFPALLSLISALT